VVLKVDSKGINKLGKIDNDDILDYSIQLDRKCLIKSNTPNQGIYKVLV